MAKTTQEIRSSIGMFSTNRDALRDLAHGILCDILIQSAPTGTHVDAGGSGETDLALEMIKEMPTSWAEQAIAWFDKFSPIRIIPSRDKKGMAQKYKNLGVKGTPEFVEDKAERDAERLKWWDVSEAINVPFHKVQGERPVKLYTGDYFDGFIDAQIKMLNKKIEDNKVDPKALNKAKIAIARLEAAKAISVAVTDEPASNDDSASSIAA